MKNLEIWDVAVGNIDISVKEKFLVCHNYNSENKINLFSITHNLQVVKTDEFGQVIWSKDISDLANTENSLINITYIALSNKLCVALGNGELITIDELGTSCELVGIFENGLLAMEWSPDQDSLVLVTKDLKMITMSCTFDPINEVELVNEEFGSKQFITVGWGKKETQFHGSEGKQAAEAKVDKNLDQNVTSDSSVKVTWRGDGNLFAVGFLMDGVRRFKVFDREGSLEYTSEKQVGLESHLIWRPSGNVIATTQKLNDRRVVAFFEKNGLKHGEFDIPINSSTIVEELHWSSDSEILTIQCKDLDTDIQKLILFTTSNYHWYQKQTLVFKEAEKISQIFWDNNFDVACNKKLHVILQNGTHYTYTWVWGVNHSFGKTDKDDAVVGVIDGKKILLTNFRQSIVPPPMASLEFEVDSEIHSVHFAPGHLQSNRYFDTNAFFVTTDKSLIFFKQMEKVPLKYEVVKTLPVERFNYPFQYYNWYWLDHATIVVIQNEGENKYNMIEYKIAHNGFSQKLVIPLPSAIVKLQGHPYDPSILFLLSMSGEILKYTSEQDVVDALDMSFNTACRKFDVFSINGQLHFLGLSHAGNLYVNNILALNNVSSFTLHTSFLLVTTLKHLLICVELKVSGMNSLIEYQKNESSQIYKRKIERGAKLVITVPNAINTIFQMPRGNIETVQPRPLSIKIIAELLNTLEYAKAFELMRKQRINLNLFYDHNPSLFMYNIDTFLNSIKDNSWLCLFLSDLDNSDVTKTMYGSSYNKKNIDAINPKKINEICVAMELHINKRLDRKCKILPLLTTYIKRNTIEDLEKALNIVKKLKSDEIEGIVVPVGSDEALKFLLYMVNVDELFNIALGMYDFELVLLIANKSQKDPKEYVPMLNDLNSIDDNYKKFSINKNLKRFAKAVKCLAMCGAEKHEELKTFVKYHSLYREALALFKPDEDIYKQISDDFAQFMRLKKDYVEAGIIYEKAKNHVKAIECFKEAREWELALSVADHLSKKEHEELCRSLVTTLREERRHAEAIIILERYVKNNEATFYAIRNGQFKTALRLIKTDKQSIIDTRLVPAILLESNNLGDMIRQSGSEYKKFRTRLQEVREHKAEKSGYMHDSYKDNDLYSDAGSTIASSSGSGRSFRSSKNRRKHQRKLTSLREGSMYEEVALIMAAYNQVVSAFNMRLPVKNLNIVLKYVKKEKEANKLQENLELLLNSMTDSFKEIWTHDLVINASKASMDAENVPEGSNFVPNTLAFLEPHMRIPPVIPDIRWKLQEIS